MNELPTQPGKVILTAQEADAWIDGFAFLERARQRLADVDQDVRQAAAQARDEGFAQGRGDGEAQAAALLAQTTRRVEAYLAGLEASMAELCLTAVRRIVGEFDDAELVARCVRQALGEYRHEMALTVRVAPERAGEVEALLARQAPPEGPAWRVEGDAQLGAGQCLLVSPVAVVDVGLDAQLNAIRSALLPGEEEA